MPGGCFGYYLLQRLDILRGYLDLSLVTGQTDDDCDSEEWNAGENERKCDVAFVYDKMRNLKL